MNAQDRAAIGSRRIRPVQRREALVFEGLHYRADAVWPFGMTGPGVVVEIRGVAQNKGGHGGQTREAQGPAGPASRLLPARPLPRCPDLAVRAKLEMAANVH